MALSAREKLAAGITRVIDPTRKSDGRPNGIAPYFGAILRGLLRREIDEEMATAMRSAGMEPTLAVSNDGILYWYPKFLLGLSVDELSGVLVHEAMHVVLRHSERATAMSIVPEATIEAVVGARLWNLAGDACINEDISKFVTLPKGCVLPSTLKQPPGLATEQRYRLLVEEMKKEQQKAGGGGQGSSKGAGSQGGSNGSSAGSGTSALPGGKGAGAGTGHCGGCAHRPVPGEPKPGKDKGGASKDGKGSGGESGTTDTGGRSEASMERMRRETAQAVREYGSKNRGTVPAALERWADEQLAPPKIPWRQKLARLARNAIAYRPGAVDYTWTRMSRRQAGVGFGVGRPVMPATHAPQPRVAVVVDTSGSMSTDALSTALSEVKGVLDAVGADITFVVCDAKVHGIRPVKNIEEAAKMLTGGGGTAMAPALTAVAKLRPMPEVCIVITDGYIDRPATPPFGTIWCIVGGNPDFTPDFGEVVHVEEEEERRAA